jgi:predicted ABC-type transport system involved in lysophospholipase L1 biosynthesis ATPase subunit
VARALASRPRVLLADEPSGNLDVSNAARLHDLFCDLAATTGTAVVAVTHNAALARRAHRVLTLDAGRLVPAALTSEDAA